MEKGAVFTPGQLKRVEQAARRAETLVGDFYCIPGREWHRIPYQVATLRDGPGPSETVFADIVQILTGPGEGDRSRPAYRIRLRDDAVLEAVERPDGVQLYPLLLYVLAHEMVHVVRFSGGQASFDAVEQDREEEETRVHAITRRLLRPGMHPGLGRVLDLYRAALPDVPVLPRRK